MKLNDLKGQLVEVEITNGKGFLDIDYVSMTVAGRVVFNRGDGSGPSRINVGQGTFPPEQEVTPDLFINDRYILEVKS